jgi:2',3'-cyclic-nucleotide 2'-phosphodiesterase/3'-nucleotidase
MSSRRLIAVLSAVLLASCQTGLQPNSHLLAPPSGSKAELVVLETTDIHSNVLSYDYFKLVEDKTLGFERLATLIRQARKEFTNTVLFDDGDTIQGTALADYQATVKPLACDQELAMYKAMDAVGYDGGTIGNHEFNYGLDFLSRATGQTMHIDGIAEEHCQGPHYPLVLANVISLKTHEPIFAPTRIIDKTVRVTAPDGSTHETNLRIGILGLTPTGIMNWDRTKLAG